jgi:hypothetical protein
LFYLCSSNYSIYYSIEDFKLVQGPLFRNIAATTCTGIMMIYNPAIKSYEATAIFDSEKSVWSNTHTGNISYLLNHEQRHFDLTEYIVRKLNKDLVGKDSLMQLKLFKVYEEQLDIIQKLYDAQTNHSVDTAQQSLWNSTIDNLLTY